jgi:hypothetical protein
VEGVSAAHIAIAARTVGSRTMSSPANERLAVVEQKVSHMEKELAKMSVHVSETHAILLPRPKACAGP